jgi:hypothetical protein
LKPSESEILAQPYKPFLPELVHAKAVAKLEPEKKKEIPAPEKKTEAEKTDRDLLDMPDKKDPPEMKKDAPAPEKKDEPGKKDDDLLEPTKKDTPQKPAQ